MYILCDTSSILMLIRIAPEMFTDPKYECETITDVKNEIFRTTKFKNKYSWRTEYKNKIKTISATELETEEYKNNLKLIKNLLDECIINENTGKIIDLSRVDKTIAAFAVTKNHRITTADKNLAAFINQQFEINNIFPLEILNDWIDKGIIKVDESIISHLQKWIYDEEPPQPIDAIKKFEKLTGRTFPKEK